MKENWIVCIDSLEGGFELVYFAETEEEARKFYDELGEVSEGRHKHIYRRIATTEEVSLDD